MAVQIRIDQAAAPPGVAGVAREDLATGVPVTLTAVGGPYAQYLWTTIWKPIDIVAAVKATSAFTAPLANVTNYTPIDQAGTYLVQVAVDSGLGLGATPDDIARISFYAGPALNADPTKLPRRIPAFGETVEHNVADAVDVGGNPDGWSREWLRWFALMSAMWDLRSAAGARVSLPGGGPAAIVRQANVFSATRTAVGIVDIVYTVALPDAFNAPSATAYGPTGGSCVVDLATANGCTVYRADPAGMLVDADFTFDVRLPEP